MEEGSSYSLFFCVGGEEQREKENRGKREEKKEIITGKNLAKKWPIFHAIEGVA